MDHVISESWDKGIILQRNYRKMAITWSFSFNFFVKFHGYFPQLVMYSPFSHSYIYNKEHNPFITLCLGSIGMDHVICESCFKGIILHIALCLGSSIELDHVIS